GAMSSVRIRVASSDWCPSRKVVSVHLMGFFPAIGDSFVVSFLSEPGAVNSKQFKIVPAASTAHLSQAAALHQQSKLHGLAAGRQAPEVDRRPRRRDLGQGG